MAITIPNTFVAGTKIEATPMNANFAETANAVDKRGDTLTGNLGANAGITVDGVDVSTIPNTSGTFNPLFAQVVIGTADTNGIRLDLESGTLAVREGDDSAYGPLTSGLLTTSGNHVPATNDGGSLGISGTAWADLFLASGGVINFNNGDVTITHATNQLTFAGADHATAPYTFSGTTNGYLFNVNNVNTGKAAIAFKTNGTTIGVIGLTGAYTGDASTNMAVFAETGYDFRVATNGSATTKFMVDTSGNVGIGVTPKTFTSGKAVEIGAAGNIAWGNGGGDMFLASNLYYNADFKYAATNAIAAMRLQDGVVKFLTAPSGTADTTATLTERFRVLNGGNIAIGATARIYLDGVAGTGDTYIEEYAANEVRLTIGGAAHSAFNATGQFVYYNPPTTASAANAYIAQTDYIRRSTSSIRYKHDITTLDTTDALAAVMAMRPVTYRGKTDEDQRRFVGFIAEEMQEIAPLLCTYDEGGESGTPNYVTYDRVTAYLVAVVQQQQQKIAALEARIH